MPGRTSVRSSRKAGPQVVDSVPAAKTTAAPKARNAATRSSAPAVQTPEEGGTTALRSRICAVFADAQRSQSTQRKLAVTLRKIQEICYYGPEKPSKRVFDEEYDENEFNEEIGRCVLRILTIKKSETVGDRLVRFLGVFLKLGSEKDNAIFRADESEAEDAFPETPTSRLTTHILSLTLQVIAAKDKIIRFRATQITAHLINTLDSIDDETFQLVRLALLKRLRDKESNVRVQAVLGLGRLADEGDDGADEEDSDDEDVSGGILRKLQDTLQHDPSADVRKALLLNLPFTPGTLPYLLERARDLDAATRRALYSRLLPALGDFRHLSLTHREKLLRWGLRDRDENVRNATARLFRERWIEDCARSRNQGEEEGDEGAQPDEPQQAAEPSIEALLELLERIDMLNSGVETGIAHEAMREFWDGRPDYREHISFDDPYFTELTPESVFIARTFNEYCKKSDDSRLQSQAEDKMPEVTKFAFLVQSHLVRLIDLVEQVALNPDDAEAEEDAVQQEFCIEQMLHIALTLDYSDEMGRRKMFSIMREALALAELPEECTKLVIENLRNVCGKDHTGEQEFCSIVLEAVAEVHDTIMGEDNNATHGAEDVDESFHSARSEMSGDATPTRNGAANARSKGPSRSAEEAEIYDEERAVREIMVNMKCLHIAQCMLQNVQCDLERNSHLVIMLNNLVVPAVRSQEAPVREKGLICLGLCCLLSKNLADENLMLFLHCFARGHPALQVIAIQIITDILTAHPRLISDIPVPNADASEADQSEGNPFIKPVTKVYSKGLRSPEPSVQSTTVTALAKLMLGSTIQNSDLLKQMVLVYFDPETASNPSLRQALTYFLPAYCHMRRKNAVAMAQITVAALRNLVEVSEDLEEEGEAMVSVTGIASQICDWTDPRKGLDTTALALQKFVDPNKLDGHMVLAEDLLEKALTPGCSKEDKKLFVSMLSKLHIDATAPLATLQSLVDLSAEALEGRIVAEVSTRNTLTRFNTLVTKASSSAAESATGSAEPTEHPSKSPSLQSPLNADTPVETTEIHGDTILELDDEKLIQAQLAAEAGTTDESAAELTSQDSEADSDTELDPRFGATRFTAPPDAEGTVMGDFYDDEEDEEDELSTPQADTYRKTGRSLNIPIRQRGGRGGVDESLLDSLLDDDDPDGIE